MTIEPCCIHKTLPPVLEKKEAVFSSEGDWTLGDFLPVFMPVSSGHRSLFICVPKVDVFILRTLLRYLECNTIDTLELLTAHNCTADVSAVFEDYADRVTYAHHERVETGCIALSTVTYACTVLGTMPIERDKRKHLFAYSRSLETHRSVLATYKPIMNIYKVKL